MYVPLVLTYKYIQNANDTVISSRYVCQSESFPLAIEKNKTLSQFLFHCGLAARSLLSLPGAGCTNTEYTTKS